MAAQCEQYVCGLDNETQEKALRELNEDARNRQGAIDTFRQWILQQKHFTCPTDNIFLLAFLRARKFSQLEARRQLEKFLKHKEKLSDWTKNLDPGSEETRAIIDDGPVLLLPGRDKLNRRVLIFRPGYIRMADKKHRVSSLRLLMTMFDSVFLSDELSQVHGAVLMADMSHDTMANEMGISNTDRMNMVQSWQSKYPARVRSVHCYNAGTVMDLVMSIIRNLLSAKMKSRLNIHSSLESLYLHIPLRMLPQEYLPDDYSGPSAGTEQQLKDAWKQEWTNHEIRDRVKYLTSTEFKIDMAQKDTDIPEASFRKLSVD